ncbi:MAG: ABC transporter permease [Terriglobia bacterium]
MDRKPDRRSNLNIVSGVSLSSILSDLPGWAHFVSFQALSTAVAFCIMVEVFFGYYPAGKVAKLNPIEALRYE